MASNITATHTIASDAWMRAQDVIRIAHLFRDDLPDDCFLNDLLDEAVKRLDDRTDMQKRVPIKEFTWGGEGSGHSFRETFLEAIASSIHGTLEAVLTWEGGDEISGLLVSDGKATECEVEYRLVKGEGKYTPTLLGDG